MVDFGNAEVQDYFSKILDRYIRTLKLAYIRWDCNLHDISAFWAMKDSPDRRGMSEIRHIEGIRRVEQFVRDRHPDVILESCASGGRRIDLATLQNRHTVWISDATAGASIIRFHLEGLNYLLPGSRQLVAFAPRERDFAKFDSVFPDIDCQCCFAGAFGTAGKLHLWPETMKQRMGQHFALSCGDNCGANRHPTVENWPAAQQCHRNFRGHSHSNGQHQCGAAHLFILVFHQAR